MRTCAGGQAARRRGRLVAIWLGLLLGVAGPTPARAAEPAAAQVTVEAVWPPAGARLAEPLVGPSAVVLDRAGRVWVAEPQADRVIRLPDPAAGTPRIATPDGVLRRPLGVAAAPDGTLLVADTGNHRIVRLAPDGRIVATYGGPGKDPGEFERPSAVAAAPDGTFLVADTGNHRVQRLDPAGRPLSTMGRLGSGPGDLVEPAGIAVAPDGRIAVADTGNHRIVLLAPDGEPLAVVGRPGRGADGLLRPTGLAYAPDGALWIADTGNHRLVRTDGERFLARIGKLGRGPGELQEPSGLAVAPNGDLLVADTANDRIQRLRVSPAALAAAEGATLAAAGRPDLAVP
ncbi:MAG TPA: NHL repeat-containing protein, partial [Thermodesulfobacteriota bacterium]